jgi:hypothetical protein
MSRLDLVGRGAAALSLAALSIILVYYADRLFLPQPIYAGDVGSYLISALFSPADAARNPFHGEAGNSLFLMAIRALHGVSGHYLTWLSVANLAGYVGGLTAVHRVSVRGLPAKERWGFLLVALAFPYYRFVVVGLPEGAYVAVLAAICVVTASLYATRPMLHAALAGGLAAALALVKPHGVTIAAAFAAVAVLEAMITGRWTRGGLRILVLAAAFLAVGNGIVAATGEPIANPLTFFVGAYYGQTLAVTPPPGAGMLGLLAFFSMISALALFVGLPCLAALGEIAGRWRAERRDMQLRGQDALVLLLMAATLATVIMVSLFAIKAAVQEGETRRLWGRYFEFFTPLLWLAAAPYLVRWQQRAGRAERLIAAGVMLAGLGGLLLSFRAGIVLFPWDATALTAFFHPDPVRASLGVRLPFRALAVAASVAAAAAIAWRAPPWRVAAPYFLALGLLSTWLDHVWVGPIAQQRTEFDADIQAAAVMTPDEPLLNAVLAVDNNDANLSFLGLGGFTQVLLAQADARPPVEALDYMNLVVVGPARAPRGWACPYRGRQLKVCVRPKIN